MSKKFIVSVGAGIMQVQFIKTIKRHGFGVVAFGLDIDKSLKDIIDYHAFIDIKDYTKAQDWINSLNILIIGVGTNAGSNSILTTQMLANYYKTYTYFNKKTCFSLNKLHQQHFLEKNNLSKILTFSKKNILQTDFAKKKKYVIKPKLGSGSKNIKIVNGTELKKIYKKIPTGQIVQEFCDGVEYRILMIVQNKKIKLFAPVKKINFKKTYLIGSLKFQKNKYQVLLQHAKKIVNSISIINSIIKYDVLINKNAINVLEIDVGYGGGFYFQKYISKLFNISIDDLYLKLLIGEKITEQKITNANLKMDYFYNESGKRINLNKKNIKSFCIKSYNSNLLYFNKLDRGFNGSFCCNSDFIFCLIYIKKNNKDIIGNF